MKPRLLDLFCGAGGCTKGYQRAGFEVMGIDIEPQPNYCGEGFMQRDALHMLEMQLPELGFDAIHASPPCQAYSYATRRNGTQDRHPDLVGPTRELLKATGLPYVIENVPGAPLIDPTQICGSGLGLRVRRHRLFETNFPLMGVPCSHGWQRSNNNRIRSGYKPPENSVVPVYGGGQAGFDVATCREAMGIPWMTTDELNNAIPPAYTEHIGQYLLTHLQAQQAVA
jgi:DNA (cytosine-5)-methyltransferase 1